MGHDGDIKIPLIQPNKNAYWQIRWNDPVTGQARQKSTRTNNRRMADRQLGELQAELIKGQYRKRLGFPGMTFAAAMKTLLRRRWRRRPRRRSPPCSTPSKDFWHRSC